MCGLSVSSVQCDARNSFSDDEICSLSPGCCLARSRGFAQGDHVPAYNNAPPKPGDAQILPKDQLWGENFKYPYQVRAYQLAAKIPDVSNQLPCYCYCERMGHNSLAQLL